MVESCNLHLLLLFVYSVGKTDDEEHTDGKLRLLPHDLYLKHNTELACWCF